MENYICINGNKTELTEEQIHQLGIKIPKVNPFERVKEYNKYFIIHGTGKVISHFDNRDPIDEYNFNVANYCTDKEMMEQRAMFETLNRRLWRFSEQNGGRGTFSIAYKGNGNFCPMIENYRYLEPTFKTHDIAQRAIKEIVEHFMKEHPDFVW